MTTLNREALEMVKAALEEKRQVEIEDHPNAYFQFDIEKYDNIYFFYLALYSDGKRLAREEFQTAMNEIERDNMVKDLPSALETTYEENVEVTEDNYLDVLVQEGTATIQLRDNWSAKSFKEMIKTELKYAEIDAVIGNVVKTWNGRTITVEMAK